MRCRHCADGGTEKWPFYSECTQSHCAGLLINATMEVNSTARYAAAPTPGMVQLKGGRFNFTTSGVMIEGACGYEQNHAFGSLSRLYFPFFFRPFPAFKSPWLPSVDVSHAGTSAQGVDIQFPWEATPRKDHTGTLNIGNMYACAALPSLLNIGNMYACAALLSLRPGNTASLRCSDALECGIWWYST